MDETPDAPDMGEMAEAVPQAKEVLQQKAKDSISKVSVLKKIHDLNVVIENTKGSIRSGDGWSVSMADDYGYIMRTVGADGDQIDCYIGDVPMSENVYVIDQSNIDSLTNEFDEHKCMLGYPSKQAAVETYLNGFNDGRGWDRLSAVTSMNMMDFKAWLENGDLAKPFAYQANPK